MLVSEVAYTARRRPSPRIGGQLALRRKEGRTAYIFLVPWLIGLVVFVFGPMVVSLYLSFTDYDFLRPAKFVGLENYARMFVDGRFIKSAEVTVVYIVLAVPLQLAFALLMALLLNRQIRGVGVYRGVFYLPSLLGSSVAVAVLWDQIFGTEGLVNQILKVFGVSSSTSWVGSPDTALLTLVLLNVWAFGSPMIIFLAGLRQIPQEVLEAARVDGAGKVRTFLYVILPLLSPIIFFNLILQTIFSFKAFVPAFIVSGGTGGPSDSTLFYTLYLYQEGFGSFRMGYASAMGWVLLLAIGIVTAINFVLSRFWVFYGDENQ